MEADALVIRLDHVTTVADNAAATKLYRSLAGIGLDVAWPYAEYPAFATGGVRVGNLILEILGVDEHAVGDWPPRFVTFAPPGLEGLVEELDARSIAHGDPEPFASGEGQPVLYTTISLPELGGPEVYVQLSAYAEPPRSEGTPSSGTAGVVETERVTIGIEDDSALALGRRCSAPPPARIGSGGSKGARRSSLTPGVAIPWSSYSASNRFPTRSERSGPEASRRPVIKSRSAT